MPARSVTVFLINASDRDLALVTSSQSLQHGEWSQYAPTVIPARGFGQWGSESDGFATGTEGSLSYTVAGTGKTAFFYWDNPFSGSNQYNSGAPPGFTIDRSGGQGNNATVDFVFRRT